MQDKMYLKRNHNFYLIFLFFVVTNSMAQTKNIIAKAQVYYLSSTGNDANTGTKNEPWKTIQKINTVSLKSGDKILLMGGDTFKGTLKLISNNADKLSQPIVVTSY